MPWFHAIAERDNELMDPTSPEKIRLLGERLRLGPSSRVLDIACGQAGPAAILASTFGCRIVGVERSPEFAASARSRLAAAGLSERVEVVEADGREHPLEAEAWDAALCLGASFVWDGLEGTLAALVPAVRPGGHVVVGEPFWRRLPLPDGVDAEDYVSLVDTVGRFQEAGLAVTTIVGASEDDWDRYETGRWRALEEWLAEHPDDPDAPEIRALHERERDQYLRTERELLGWAIFAGRKPPRGR